MTDPFEEEKRISEDALKYFTDREHYIQAFLGYVNAGEEMPLNVLVFCGVGGVGKTTLIRKLGLELTQTTPPFPKSPLPFARFNLENITDPVRSYRQALLHLRTDLGRDYNIEFPRFDLCLAMILANEGGSAPDLVKVNPTLSKCYAFALDVSPIPMTGTMASVGGFLIKRAAAHSAPLEKWLRRAGGTEDVISLRERARHDDQTLPDELMKRFAQDLREGLKPRAGKACRGVLFLDSHERLWRERETDRSQEARSLDVWVRQLARFCLFMGVLPVITGRDHLRWDEDDPQTWTDRLEQHLLGGLSARDAQTFLSKCGIGPDEDHKLSPLQRAIIDCCNEESDTHREVKCHTFFLALCAEIALNRRLQIGRDADPATFHNIPHGKEADELAARFLQSLNDGPMESWLEELSLTPRFDRDAALSLRGTLDPYIAQANWEALIGYSFATPQPDGTWRLHATMREALRLRVSDGDARRVHQHFLEYWQSQDNAPLAFAHRWFLDPTAALDAWSTSHKEALQERRIPDARRMLTWWTDIPLSDSDRLTVGDAFWAKAHSALGLALSNTPIAPSAAALSTAIAHYESALRVYTEEDFPQEWATTQHSLGNVCLNLPTGDRTENLRRAIRHYEAALRVRTETDFPQQWAGTQNNLAIAYNSLPTGDCAENLRQAILYYEAALRVYTEEDFPQGWAMTQQNLAIAYSDLPTGDHTANVERAIACFEAALRACTEDALPQQWATTQNNLGNAYKRLPTGDYAENQQRAIGCFEAALRVHTEADFPQEWAMTQNNLAIAYRNLPLGDHAANQQRIIACFEAALRVWTEADFPQEWSEAQNNLGNAYSDLPTGDRAANVRRAIDYLNGTLRVRTEAKLPQQWAETQNNLGNVYRKLPANDSAESLRQAISYYEAARRVYTEADFPQGWAVTQQNHGLALMELAQATKDMQALLSAREHFALAERGFSTVGMIEKASEARGQQSSVGAALHEARQTAAASGL